MEKHSELLIYTDGGARGNPGPAGIGIVIYDQQKKLISTHKRYIGEATNNQAEYQAVIEALEQAAALGAKAVKLVLDSELVVKQLRGEYKIKNQGLIPLVQKIFRLSNNFSSVTFTHVPREQNKLADKLVNEALNEAGQ